jgi:hypothetical protein
LVAAAAAGHISVQTTDPAQEQAFRTAGVSGQFGPAPGGGDFVGLSWNNATGDKVDYYMKRELAYDVTLAPGGAVTATTTVSYTNTAPKGAKPSYALTPYPYVAQTEHLKTGDNFSIVAFSCATGCEIGQVRRGDNVIDTATGDAGGIPLSATAITIRPQETVTLTYPTTVTDVWTGSSASGSYGLRLQAPPVIKPVAATVTVHIPVGTSVTHATEGMKIVPGNDTATWSGDVGKWTDLKVSFGKPFISRTWTRITDFLKKPVFKL